MIKPILACENPYETAQLFAGAGWNIDFSQPPESGDPLVGVSLLDNFVLLGVTDGYVSKELLPYRGCGVEIYLTVPMGNIQEIYDNHSKLHPTALAVQPWGDLAFEVTIDGYRFFIAAQNE